MNRRNRHSRLKKICIKFRQGLYLALVDCLLLVQLIFHLLAMRVWNCWCTLCNKRWYRFFPNQCRVCVVQSVAKWDARIKFRVVLAPLDWQSKQGQVHVCYFLELTRDTAALTKAACVSSSMCNLRGKRIIIVKFRISTCTFSLVMNLVQSRFLWSSISPKLWHCSISSLHETRSIDAHENAQHVYALAPEK